MLLEIGPRATLSTLARQACVGKRALPPADPGARRHRRAGARALAAALGQLWSLGAAIDWDGYRRTERRRRVPLPTYPFERKRYWVEAPAASAQLVAAHSLPGAAALDSVSPVVTGDADVTASLLPIVAPGSSRRSARWSRTSSGLDVTGR